MASSKSFPNKFKESSAWINGFIGVLIFSGSLPATRVAVMEFTPVCLTFTRAFIAGLLALFILLIFKEKRPLKRHFIPLTIVSTSCVIGFPLLTALALKYITSAHSLVFIGILPLITAVFGVVRGGERLKPAFWISSILGSLFVVCYSLSRGISLSSVGDVLMFLAITLCAFGYSEGAILSKTLGGWQVISWALVLSLPFTAPIVFFIFPPSVTGISMPAWIGLAYVSVFSMLIGFIFWYRGLAQGGIAAVGQLQLLQPFIGLILAATLLHEQVTIGMLGATIGVILCVAGSKKFAK